jgi:chemotaxis response regulator CheB
MTMRCYGPDCALLDAESDLRIVGEAGDGAIAVRLAHELQPDVVVIDLSIPVLDCVAAAGCLPAWGPVDAER